MNTRTPRLCQLLRHRAKPVLAACACAMVCVLLGLPAQAAEKRSSIKDLASPPSGSSFAPAPGVSLERATAIARKHTGGRVLSATPKQRSNGVEYRVRMLVDGERVMTVVVDPKGRIKNKR